MQVFPFSTVQKVADFNWFFSCGCWEWENGITFKEKLKIDLKKIRLSANLSRHYKFFELLTNSPSSFYQTQQMFCYIKYLNLCEKIFLPPFYRFCIYFTNKTSVQNKLKGSFSFSGIKIDAKNNDYQIMPKLILIKEFIFSWLNFCAVISMEEIIFGFFLCVFNLMKGIRNKVLI